MTDTPTPPPPLMPCPFCGGAATVYDGKHNRAPRFSVGCKECSFEIWPNDSRDQAIEIWDTRPSSNPRDSDMAVVREALSDWLELEITKRAYMADERSIRIIRDRIPVAIDAALERINSGKDRR